MKVLETFPASLKFESHHCNAVVLKKKKKKKKKASNFHMISKLPKDPSFRSHLLFTFEEGSRYSGLRTKITVIVLIAMPLEGN